MWAVFKVFVEFTTILFLGFVLFFFWPSGTWDLSPQMRGRIHTPCIERWSLNHQTARDYAFTPFSTHISASIFWHLYSGLTPWQHLAPASSWMLQLFSWASPSIIPLHDPHSSHQPHLFQAFQSHLSFERWGMGRGGRKRGHFRRGEFFPLPPWFSVTGPIEKWKQDNEQEKKKQI